MPLSDEEQRQLGDAAGLFGIELVPRQNEQFGRYLDLIQQWRTHARLISQRQTRSDIIGKHIADAFALVSELGGHRRIADVGSGGGFPGIPVAILLPDAEIALIEANQRKVSFLHEVIRQLGLRNVTVLDARVEAVRTDLRFDAVVSRAVGAVGELATRARRLVGPDALVIAMKGPAAEQELAATDLTALGFELQSVKRYRLGSGETRLLVILRFT